MAPADLDAAGGQGRSDRARSFGAAAAAYERSRPGYPAAAVRDLLGEAPRDVLDLGAGTGKLTRTLLEAGHRVTAVDPSEGMLAELARVLPEVPRRPGTAESLPFPAASFDAVVAGQAAHWFDPATANPEIARVLRPDGLVGLLWNVRDEGVAWVARFGELVGSNDAIDDGDAIGADDLRPAFGTAAVRWYAHTTTLTVDQLVDLGHSRSTLITMPGAERAERLLAIRAVGTAAALDGVVTMPYRLQVWSARVAGA